MSTKIHAATDSLGNPVRLIGGPGQENDIVRAGELIAGLEPDHVLADRAYDADHFHDAILEAGAIPVIPPKRNRRHQHHYDKEIYKERNRVERLLASPAFGSTSSSTSAVSQPDTTNCSPTSWASPPSPLSQSNCDDR